MKRLAIYLNFLLKSLDKAFANHTLLYPIMKVTQKDIAKKLGVSTSLVSRVLSGRAEEIGIRKELIKQVQELAEKMRYVPSSAALSLKGKKSSTVGVVVYDFNDPYFTKVISKLQSVALEENYSILLVGFLNRGITESSLRPLYKHSVDGIIIVGSYGDLSWLDNFDGIPVARIGHGSDAHLKLCTCVDENLAMDSIARHLQEQGIRRVAFARRNTPVHADRELSFLNAFAKGGKFTLTYARNSINESSVLAGMEIADKLFREDTLPEAVVCATDTLAMGVVKRFSELGLNVPDDILVTGFDDIDSASFFMPTITSYHQPVEIIARKAFYAVSKGEGQGDFNVEGMLVIRKSSTR